MTVPLHQPWHKHGHREYALLSHHKECPTAVYVGGTSRFLCRCDDPATCEGAMKANAQLLKAWNPSLTPAPAPTP